MSATRLPLTRPSLRSGLPHPAVGGVGGGEGRDGHYMSAASEV
jgi:hypothetical protein